MNPLDVKTRSILIIAETTAQPASKTTRADAISYATGECALGQVLVARSAKGVCAVLIGADRCELGVDLACRFPSSTLVATEPIVREDPAKVIRFVDRPVENLGSRPTCEGRRSSGQSDRTGRSLPPRRAELWRSGWISLGRGAQA